MNNNNDYTKNRCFFLTKYKENIFVQFNNTKLQRRVQDLFNQRKKFPFPLPLFYFNIKGGSKICSLCTYAVSVHCTASKSMIDLGLIFEKSLSEVFGRIKLHK